MIATCEYLHHALSKFPRFRREDLAKITANGVYILFEKGEIGHAGERIVRIGTHRGQNNLPLRLREHLYTPNKDRSIFRKHVGRCLLARAQDAFLSQWEMDLTAKASRETNGQRIDKVRLQAVEEDVTRYMIESFSFTVLRCDTPAERLHIEQRLLSTVFSCPDCGPSETWLGKFHPKSTVIKQGGLWNVQGLLGPLLVLEDAQRIVSTGAI